MAKQHDQNEAAKNRTAAADETIWPGPMRGTCVSRMSRNCVMPATPETTGVGSRFPRLRRTPDVPDSPTEREARL